MSPTIIILLFVHIKSTNTPLLLLIITSKNYNYIVFLLIMRIELKILVNFRHFLLFG